MPNISQNDPLNDAMRLKSEAMAILGQAEVGAEDLERADNLLKEAEAKAGQGSRLRELKSRVDGLQFEVNPAEQKAKGTTSRWGSDFGKYLLSIREASKGIAVPGLEYFESEVPNGERKDLAEAVGSSGGYTVPREFRPLLMHAAEEQSIVRKRAMVIPMSRRQLEVPALKQDGTTPGEPHWFGGMVAFWEAEAATIQETEPQFRNITLTAHELVALTHTSNTLLADSAISLSALLTGPRGFPGVIAWKEDYAFLNGSGVGEPLGVLNSPATISVARTTGGEIKYDDLVNMMGRMLPSGNAVWVASIAARPKLMLMNGPSGNASYLWGSAREGVPDTLLGMPIIFTEKVPAVGTRGDISLMDFSHYYLGDRQSTTIESTDQARWVRNQTSWKVVHRVDGQPWLNAPFTLADGATTISPFVTLAT